MTLVDYLKNDPLWQKAKEKTMNLRTDKTLTKVEYLRVVGHKAFSHKNYQAYLESREIK